MTGYSALEIARILEKIPADAGSILECSLNRPELAAAALERHGDAVEVLFPGGGGEDDPQAAERRLQLERWRAKAGSDPYGCILCADSIAEVRDHDSVLEHLLNALRPGGLLVLAIPNLQFFRTVAMVTEGRWEYAPGTAVARNYLRFFTPKSINQTLQNVGFDPVGIFPLRVAPESDFPRDDQHCITQGRVTIGPLNDSEYLNYRTERLLIAAKRP